MTSCVREAEGRPKKRTKSKWTSHIENVMKPGEFFYERKSGRCERMAVRNATITLWHKQLYKQFHDMNDFIEK